MPLLAGKKNIGRNIETEQDAGKPHEQAIAIALDVARRKHKAEGGSLKVHTPKPPTKMHTGPIHSSVAGRTDHLPMTVKSGSYVIPSDIVSASGEGNTIAGFKHARRVFGGNPYGGSGATPYGQGKGPYGMASGGSVKHRAAGILFKSPDDKILLMRRAGRDHRGEWGLPGGGIEKGETEEQAARREFEEETGHRYKGSMETATRRVRDGVDFTTFLAHAEPFQPKLNDEHDAHKWVTPSEAKEMNLHPGVRSTLARIAKAGGGASSGVPIIAAGGEYVVDPDQVEEVGGGDLDTGHRVLDDFVLRMRKELIHTLKHLKPPQKD